jgi:S-formylglutathione hydrolase FrmB
VFKAVRRIRKDETLRLVGRHGFTSAALGKRTGYLVWLPRLVPGERVPLLVLLHGADSSPAEVAERMHEALTHAAQTARVAILAVEGGANSWWLDSPELAHSRYASMVAVDLLGTARANLPVSESRGIMGISMGGHGALSIALDHPGLFRSASSVSGVVDLTLAHDRPVLSELLGPLGTQPERWHAHSALHKLASAPAAASGMALRLSCGSSDRWIEANRALHRQLEALHIAHDYDEASAGHEWRYWQEIIPAHVAWHARALRD